MRAAQLVEQVVRRRLDGESVIDEALISGHPELMPELGQKLRDLRSVEDAALEARMEADAAAKLPAHAIPGYTLRSEIHRGAQGVVYLATQQSTGRKVAVKVMHEGPFHGLYDRARFDREVRLLARLKHPNIVTIFDSGTASGSHYFVMAYIDGRALNHGTVAGMSLRAKLTVFLQVCEAVHAAHLQGIIHRDLKPGNIHITDDGRPHVLDFGLARVVVESEERTRSRTITVTGQFVGSLPWASPEQAEGDPSLIDVRTDVYSLGVVLYELFTGRLPYDVTGGMRQALANIIETDPIRPRSICKSVDDELETIILKCLSKDRKRRYQSAGELARDIRHYLANEPIEAKRDSTLYMLRKQVRRHRVPVMVAAAFILLLIVSSVVAWSLYVKSQDRLVDSYLAQARLTRRSGTRGQRLDALDVLGTAAAIRPTIELRNEAIAAMALPDVQVLRTEKTAFGSSVPVITKLDPTGKYFCARDTSTLKEAVYSAKDLATLFTLPEVAPECKWIGPRFRHDGRFLIRASDAVCEIWDVERGSVAARFRARVHRGGTPFDFAPGGLEIVLANESGAIEIIDFESNARRTLSPAGPVSEVRCSPIGGQIATSSNQSRDVLIRDAQSGDVLHALRHPQGVWIIEWSADGSRLSSGCNDNRVYVWRASDGALEGSFRGHESPVSDVGFNASGSLLYSSSWEGATCLWDLRTGSRLLTVPSMRGLTFCGKERFGFVSTDGDMLLGSAGVVKPDAWYTFAGIPAQAESDRCEWVTRSPDGRLAVSATHSGIRVWDVNRRTEIVYVPIGNTFSALFGFGGRELFTVGDAGIRRWPIRYDDGIVHIGPPAILRHVAGDDLREACLHTNGARLFVASRGKGKILDFDLEINGLAGSVGPHDSVRYLDISPDDRWLATGSWAGNGVKVWDLVSGKTPHELPIGRDASVAFSPDGRWLVTSGAESIIWDVGTWKAKARFRRSGYASVPGPIAFTPDGTLLAVAKAARPARLQLIDMDNFDPIASLESPSVSLMPESIAFAADGTRLFCPDPKQGHILYAWDLRAMRNQLATLGLDWDLPPYPPAPPGDDKIPVTLEVDLGDLAPKSESSAD